MTFISQHKSISELYSEMCILVRSIQRYQKDGTAKCAWCLQQKSVHLHDGRCSIAATSHEFLDERQGELDKADTALKLLEELSGIS